MQQPDQTDSADLAAANASPDVLRPGKVAVVTGAASGIGLGLTRRFLDRGMRVVLADVEEPELARATAELTASGADVTSVVTDVSQPASVEALRDRALTAYGAVHIACLNAGVGGPHGALWEVTRDDIDWVMGVNVGGVVNGIRSFVPVLLEQDRGHLVTTASVFGIFAGTLGTYGPSKHAAVALSESVSLALREAGAPVGVTVLCPSAVTTRIHSSERNRPAGAAPPAPETSGAGQGLKERLGQLVSTGLDPLEVADMVLDAVTTGRFYVMTSDLRVGAVLRRAQEIVEGRVPAPPIP